MSTGMEMEMEKVTGTRMDETSRSRRHRSPEGVEYRPKAVLLHALHAGNLWQSGKFAQLITGFQSTEFFFPSKPEVAHDHQRGN